MFQCMQMLMKTEIPDADLETIWNVPIISDTESENDINLPVHYTYMKRYI